VFPEVYATPKPIVFVPAKFEMALPGENLLGDGFITAVVTNNCPMIVGRGSRGDFDEKLPRSAIKHFATA
jgi:hypothetical protein